MKHLGASWLCPHGLLLPCHRVMSTRSLAGQAKQAAEVSVVPSILRGSKGFAAPSLAQCNTFDFDRQRGQRARKFSKAFVGLWPSGA